MFGVGKLEKKRCHRNGLLVGCCQLLHGPNLHLNIKRSFIASEATRIVVRLLNETISRHRNCQRELRMARYSGVHSLGVVQDGALASHHILYRSATLFEECYRQAQWRLQPSAYPGVIDCKDMVTGIKHCAARYVHGIYFVYLH